MCTIFLGPEKMNSTGGKMTNVDRMDRGFTVCCLTIIAIFIEKIFMDFQTFSFILVEFAFSIFTVCLLRSDHCWFEAIL